MNIKSKKVVKNKKISYITLNIVNSKKNNLRTLTYSNQYRNPPYKNRTKTCGSKRFMMNRIKRKNKTKGD